YNAAESLSPYPVLHPPMLLNSRDLVSGYLECHEMPLRKRYRNTHRWVRWLEKNGVEISPPTEGIWNYRIFWLDRYSRHHPIVCHTFIRYSIYPTNSARLVLGDVSY